MARYCSSYSCTNKAQTRGLCRRHYDEQRDFERAVDMQVRADQREREQEETRARAVRRAAAQDAYDSGKHTVRTAYILAVLGGLLGVHAFYLGRPLKALFFLLTLGGFLIWWAIDLVTLPRQVLAWNKGYAREISRRHKIDSALIVL